VASIRLPPATSLSSPPSSGANTQSSDCGLARDRRNVHRQSAQVSRLLKRLQLHGLLAKVPRSRRWRVTAKGQRMMSMALIFHGDWYPQALTDDAA
jgi:hypothetical protein